LLVFNYNILVAELRTSGGNEQTVKGNVSVEVRNDGGVSCVRNTQSFLIEALLAQRELLELRHRPFGMCRGSARLGKGNGFVERVGE
jgi:hypothetical protein